MTERKVFIGFEITEKELKLLSSVLLQSLKEELDNIKVQRIRAKTLARLCNKFQDLLVDKFGGPNAER